MGLQILGPANRKAMPLGQHDSRGSSMQGPHAAAAAATTPPPAAPAVLSFAAAGAVQQMGAPTAAAHQPRCHTDPADAAVTTAAVAAAADPVAAGAGPWNGPAGAGAAPAGAASAVPLELAETQLLGPDDVNAALQPQQQQRQEQGTPPPQQQQEQKQQQQELPALQPIGQCKPQQHVDLQPHDLLVSSHLRGDTERFRGSGLLQHQLYPWQVRQTANMHPGSDCIHHVSGPSSGKNLCQVATNPKSHASSVSAFLGVCVLCMA